MCRLISLLFLLLHLHMGACAEKVCNAVITTEIHFQKNGTQCINSHICNRTFTVSYIQQYESYIKTRNNILKIMLAHCCGNCWKFKSPKNLTNTLELRPATKDSPDFIYPVLGKKSSLQKYGYHFVPVFGIESVMYITRDEKPQIILEMVSSYPLLIISMLLAMISGFIVWLLETWKNEDEFSRAFPIGWFEGTWYSIISMTTVGYGDKAPKSIIGKLFAIIWICIGLLLCAIITATVTTSVLNANSPPPPDMKGARVGMMKYRDFEGYVTAMLGGKKIEVNGNYFQELIVQLIVKLEKNEIDGFVLDKSSFYHISKVLSDFLFDRSRSDLKRFANHTKEIEYFMYKTLVTEKRYPGLELYNGILMKKEEDYDYFQHVMRDNQFVLQRLREEFLVDNFYNKSLVNNRRYYSTTADILFAPDGNYFQSAVIATAIINGFFCAIGIVYEVRKRRNASMGTMKNNGSSRHCSVETYLIGPN